MQAIVHLGTEKTGTMSIQSLMKLNRQELANGLVCYPSTPGQSNQMKLGAFATNDDKREDLRALKAFRPATLNNFGRKLFASFAMRFSRRTANGRLFK